MQYSITTFIGPGDLQTLSPPEVQEQIRDLTIQGNPLDLLPQSFNVRSARTDLIALQMEIDQKILRLASPMICNEKMRPWARGLRLMRLKTIGHGRGGHPWWAQPLFVMIK